jgi:hypothetical protein
MREVAAAGEAVQPKAISAASAVRNVPLILLPKRLDSVFNAICVPCFAADKVLNSNEYFQAAAPRFALWRASLAGFRQFLPRRFTEH